mmetsp:Transcript_21952/g.46305  ORF Transcript_21952/g.46305 Transcript_21952/m.46305 type:complete len:220 (+) Transcript_21952:919-1578(+)
MWFSVSSRKKMDASSRWGPRNEDTSWSSTHFRGERAVIMYSGILAWVASDRAFTVGSPPRTLLSKGRSAPDASPFVNVRSKSKNTRVSWDCRSLHSSTDRSTRVSPREPLSYSKCTAFNGQFLQTVMMSHITSRFTLSFKFSYHAVVDPISRTRLTMATRSFRSSRATRLTPSLTPARSTSPIPGTSSVLLARPKNATVTSKALRRLSVEESVSAIAAR